MSTQSHNKIGISILIAGLINACPLFAEMYKWTDEDGNVHYSQLPPSEDQNVVEVIESRGYKDSDEAKKEVEALNEKLDKIREERLKSQEQEKKEAEEQELKKKNCEAAKAKYNNNLNSRRIRAVDEEGNVTRISEEARQQRINEAKANIEKWCN